MSPRPDYFARLDAELAACTRAGAHLPARPRQWGRATRRTAAMLALVIALAASLVSEFPASASGHARSGALAQTARQA